MNNSKVSFIKKIYATHKSKILLVNKNSQLCVVKVSSNLSVIENEKQILKELNHANIIELRTSFDVPWLNSENILFLEYFSSNTLHDFLTCKTMMYLHESTIIKQLVSAVSYLHNLQVPVIHKDIKPTNILVNNLGKVKLIDFGLSSKKTDIKNIKIGTRFYIAPECSGDYICEKVDIYSLGVVFYCIINRTIYEGETMVITCPDMKCLIKQMLDSDPRKRLHINDVKEKLKLIYYNL